ncbi:MAG: VOC family protein [Caenibius sp.]
MERHCMERPTIRLGYAGFQGDMAQWRGFGSDLFGLQPIDGERELRFRIDERAWRIAVRQDDDPGLDYIGLEVDTHEALDAMAERLRHHGHPAEEDPELAARRQVYRLLRTESPDGTKIELVIGGLTLSEPFASPTGATFVAGDAGLGHVLLLVPDIDAALAFFVDVIGLRRSDSIEVVPGSDGHSLTAENGTTSSPWRIFPVSQASTISILKLTGSAPSAGSITGQ